MSDRYQFHEKPETQDFYEARAREVHRAGPLEARRTQPFVVARQEDNTQPPRGSEEYREFHESCPPHDLEETYSTVRAVLRENGINWMRATFLAEEIHKKLARRGGA